MEIIVLVLVGGIGGAIGTIITNIISSYYSHELEQKKEVYEERKAIYSDVSKFVLQINKNPEYDNYSIPKKI